MRQYEIPGQECVYAIIKKYLDVTSLEGRFYRRPLASTKGIAFSKQPIGVNTLGQYMQNMFKEAGIDTTNRRISNHSARVFQVTTLYNSGHDSYDIKTRSGHRSDVTDRYKRPNSKRKLEVSKDLDVLPSARPDAQPKQAPSDVSDAPLQKEKLTDSDKILEIRIPDNVDKLRVVCKGKTLILDL